MRDKKLTKLLTHHLFFTIFIYLLTYSLKTLCVPTTYEDFFVETCMVIIQCLAIYRTTEEIENRELR